MISTLLGARFRCASVGIEVWYPRECAVKIVVDCDHAVYSMLFAVRWRRVAYDIERGGFATGVAYARYCSDVDHVILGKLLAASCSRASFNIQRRPLSAHGLRTKPVRNNDHAALGVLPAVCGCFCSLDTVGCPPCA